MNCMINSGRKTINPVMNYFTEIATWILKCTFIAYHCVPPLRSPASLGILRWGNTSDQKLEVGELRSPASYYTLTTGYNCEIYWSCSRHQQYVLVISRHINCTLAAFSLQWVLLLLTRQESPADAVKPARHKSMPKLLQFDVFRFISPNFISPNCQCIASRLGSRPI